MKLEFLRSIRIKFLFVFLGSLAVTGGILFVGQIIATSLVYNLNIVLLSRATKLVIKYIGSDVTVIVVGTITFFTCFLILSIPISRNLKQVERGLREMAAGNFSPDMRVHSADEIGDIARQYNQTASALNEYLRDITYGLEEIAKGQLAHRIPEKSMNDLGRVATNINQMSDKLSRTIQDERNAEKTKHDLITGVSHDLRTPLTSILGFLELIEQDRYKDEVELRYYVHIAYEKSNSLKKLIDDLFEYTRINNGIPLHKNKIDLRGFVEQVADEFVPNLEQANMTCKVRVPSQSIPVNVDGSMLVRAYENLLSNAVRYGAAGTRVEIEVRVGQGEAIVTIANEGATIPERDLPYIFERFYRVEQSRSKQTGGTGLGLAITKSIISLHEGSISVESHSNRTTFEMRLPLALLPLEQASSL